MGPNNDEIINWLPNKNVFLFWSARESAPKNHLHTNEQNEREYRNNRIYCIVNTVS